MNSKLLLLGLLLVCGQAFAQVTLSKQVIGCTGGYTQIYSNVDLSYTSGEAAVITISNNETTLTQGFHQSGTIKVLGFDIVATPTTCPFAADGVAEVVNISGCSPPYNVLWSNGMEGSTVTHLTAGIYSVEVISNGCSLIQNFEILAGPQENCDIEFLNAFSPNGDGINDNWEIENIEEDEFRSNHIEIFNRWGQLIWEGSGYNNSSVVWDGDSSKGDKLSEGTYFYIANVANRLYKGYIEITR